MRRHQKISEDIRRYQKISKGIKRYQKVSEGIRIYKKASKTLHHKKSKNRPRCADEMDSKCLGIGVCIVIVKGKNGKWKCKLSFDG